MRTVYVIRHGLAEAGGPAWPDDSARPLTAKGESQMRQAVRGLKRLDVVVDLVLTSPYARAKRTADLVAAGLAPRPAVVMLPALAPGGALDAVVRALGTHRRHNRIALVGHGPAVGELVSRLAGPSPVDFRKGAVARIDFEAAAESLRGRLRWLLPAKVLRRTGR